MIKKLFLIPLFLFLASTCFGATHTYDYLNITYPSSTHVGYWGISTSASPMSPLGSEYEFGTAGERPYSNVSYSDDLRNDAQGEGATDFPAFRMKFKIEEATTIITAVAYSVEGLGGTNQPEYEPYGWTLWAYNVNTTAWDNINSTGDQTEVTLTGSLNLDYMDANGYIELEMVVNNAQPGGTSLWVDYVYVTITYKECTLTGTAVPTQTETDIVTGGKTIILTLTDDTWVAAGVAFNAQRQNIINGIDSAQSEATGWDAEVKAKQGVTGVVRTSDTVVTITLDAQAAYNITATETITATIPAGALTGGNAVTATPTFTVTPITARRVIIIE